MTSPFLRHGETMRVSKAGPLDCRTAVPGSKSLTNRYLLLAALARGQSRLVHPLQSDDTVYMRAALAQVGVTVVCDETEWRVEGTPRWSAPAEALFVGNAGTVMRFFSPALALAPTAATITGNERMLVRPIADLVAGLRQLGARVGYQGREGFPPLRIQGPMRAGTVDIRGDSSSQYLSGLLMVLPLLEGDSLIRLEGPLVSRTYVEMTLNCMSALGVVVQTDADFRQFRITGGQHYRAGEIVIEPDASTASYWFALPLMVGGSVEVLHVPDRSDQGDFGLLDILARMGARIERTGAGVRVGEAPLKGIDVDMNTMSDVAPTLAVIATRAGSPTTIRNIGNMRIKECDRIDTLQTAFDQLGLKMESGPDWIKVHPGAPCRAATLNPEEDHRMAMVYALLGLASGGVRILEPQCVAKTYPAFFEEFGAVLRARS